MLRRKDFGAGTQLSSTGRSPAPSLSSWEAAQTGQTRPSTGKPPGSYAHPSLTMIRSGIIEEVEDGDQDVQHITALEHKEEEFLEGGSERVGRVRGETPLLHPLPIPGAFPEAVPLPG